MTRKLKVHYLIRHQVFADVACNLMCGAFLLTTNRKARVTCKSCLRAMRKRGAK